MEVRIFNTNTNRLLVERLHVSTDGNFQEEGNYHIAGVSGTGSCIRVSFVKPGGAMTGELFPSGQRIDTLRIPSSSATAVEIRATLLDAANPFVFVDSSSLPTWFHELDPDDPKALDFVELTRREGAVRFGLAKNVEAAARVRGAPKIAILSRSRARLHDVFGQRPSDIEVQSFSMGKAHPSFQLTGTVCLAAALKLEGTVAWNLSRPAAYATPPHTPDNEDNGNIGANAPSSTVVIQHRSGRVEAEILSSSVGTEGGIECVSVFRTARRLFEGSVFV
jgi:2-methylaconitate cis-trans-isomerase PrpF